MPQSEDEIERLTASQIIRLPKLKYEPWLEVIGEYLGSTEMKQTYHMAIRIKEKVWRISVPIKSKEKDILETIDFLDDSPFQLQKRKRRVKILFTDDPEIPVRLKVIEWL